MQLALVSCCKTKRAGGIPSYQPHPPISTILSTDSYSRLLHARRHLAAMLGIEAGPDLGFDTDATGIRYLPAFERYRGIVYSKANVAEMYPRAKSIKLAIVSALYGLIDADDPIRDYDLRMSDMLPSGMRVNTWWRHMGLGQVLADYAIALEPDGIHDLLSGDYRQAVRSWQSKQVVGLTTRYEYPGLGTGSNWRRGDDLLRLLEGRFCD